MSVCALTPIVRIYEDFDKMSAEELSYCESNKDMNRNEIVVIKKVPSDCSSSCEEDSPKCSHTTQRDDDKPKRTRKLSDGRKKSSSNLLYKCSKSFADTHQHSNSAKKPTDDARTKQHQTTSLSSSSSSSSSSRRHHHHHHHLDPHRSPGGLRKHVLNRRSPSPLGAADIKRIMSYSHGYEQYQRLFLEVPLPRDYGYASSDDLSSEWDSDVPDLDAAPKVLLFKITF